MAGGNAKGGRKNRKFGRNKKYCEYYRNMGLRIKNKIRRIRRHLEKYPGDQRARSRLKQLGWTGR